jgi:hypothetical protein
MCRASASGHDRPMTTTHTPRTDTPRSVAAELARTPTLPTGPDERVAGFGIMGLPFADGHVLALRDFPAASFLPDSTPGYQSVWHRDPAGVWTFYATTPAQLSCTRYFSSVTGSTAVQCPIDVTWTGDYSLVIDIPEVLHWSVELKNTRESQLLSNIGMRLPDRVWTDRHALAVIGRVAGAALHAGRVRLTGTLPNGQRFRVAPKQVWMVSDSRATLRGRDLGPVGPLPVQARLGDFRIPQRGLAVRGQGLFDAFDSSRHVSADSTW